MIKKLLDGAGVLRWHTQRMLRQQTVAEHSFRAALILLAVYPDCRIELLRAMLTHDLAEIETGDVPATTKWAHPALAKELKNIESDYETRNNIHEDLSEEERYVLKWCDYVELMSWCAEEAKMGNTYALGPYDKIHRLIMKMDYPTPYAKQVLKEITL